MFQYTAPEIKRKKSGWYIYYRFNGTIIRRTGNINRIKNLKDREIEAIGLLNQTIAELKNGYNPITKEYEKTINTDYNFERALKFALGKHRKALSSKSHTDYNNGVKQIIQAANRLKMDVLPIAEITRQHLKQIFENFYETPGLTKRYPKISNKRYNKVLGYIKPLFSELVEWQIIPANPATDIKYLPVTEGAGYSKANDAQQEIIANHLKKNNYQFYVFYAFLYHSLQRPKEVLSLQVKDFKRDLSEFIIIPDLETENAKTKKNRPVPIIDHLKELLLPMNIFSYPDNYYVFGVDRIDRSHTNFKKMFQPGEFMTTRKQATELWKKLIKDGLGLKVDLYATKHKSIDDKLLDDVGIDSLRHFAGHATKQMTERYASVLKQIAAKDVGNKSKKI